LRRSTRPLLSNAARSLDPVAAALGYDGFMEARDSKPTYAEYLDRERTSDVKHVWVRGEVFAMSGASRRHNRIATALLGELYVQLRDGPCRPVNSDQRVRVDAADATFYPDVSVICGEDETADLDPEAIANPSVVFEVLSPSTEAWDRGGKFAALQQLPSLTHYVLLAQDRARVEVYERETSHRWTLTVLEEGELELTTYGVSIPMERLYAR
jgi:Uma2 family endonuclease